MIPVRLEVTNFLAYRSPAPLDFAGIHVAVLAGENGAGKSSLLDAITWALWSKARAKTDNELVHQGQTDMRVEFTFALGERQYRVVRAKKLGKGATSLLDLQSANEAGQFVSISEATIPKTQDKINRLLRLTHETFVNSAYLVQGQADAFTSKRAADRKQVLADILGLQEWEVYEARAKEKIKAIDVRLAVLEQQLKEFEDELNRRPEYERELIAAQARVIEVGERLRQAETGWAQIDAARQAMIGLERQINDLTRRIGDLEKDLSLVEADLREAQLKADTTAIYREQELTQRSLASLEEQEAERETVTAARQTAAELAVALRGQNDAARAEADVLKKRLEALEAATEPRCPTCGQPLDEPARAELVASLNQEVDARRGQYRENQSQLKKLADDLAAYDRWLQQTAANLRGKSALVRRAAELAAALDSADEARERLGSLQERRDRWSERLEADKAQRAHLEVEAEQHNRVLQDAAARQRAVDQLRQEDTLAKAAVGAAEQKLAALEGQVRRRELKRAERLQLADQRGLHEELRDAFGKKGVPALMIEAAVPEIEASANALLARMTGGRMHVRFNTQRETQAGETRETLDIQIADELGTRAYENYSGGEQFRVNFAIRVALSQLLARRAGAQLQTLIMDEGFGVLDAAGRERLVEAINAAQRDFQRILVVTHIEELKDAFPARIEIVKGPNGSEIAVR
ncbi:MAG: SMC family ATPase [Anaerolineales bacterium]|nr:SMC family ATPase [Anaerolineales bacterium]